MANKFTIMRWTVYAFIANLWIEWRNGRLEKSCRRWTAHKIDGGGVVPLGRLNQSNAIDKAAKFGTVRYVDTECAVVFYSE